MENTLSRLEKIFKNILDDENLKLTPQFSQTNYEDWDSVATVQIVLAIEAEFKVRFTAAELVNLKSVQDILDLLAKKM